MIDSMSDQHGGVLEQALPMAECLTLVVSAEPDHEWASNLALMVGGPARW